jgi:hypothetical protein
MKASHARRMVNCAFYGDMLTDKAPRSEFMQECATIERSA